MANISSMTSPADDVSPVATVPEEVSAGARRIVFVVGSGRSGTSTISGALQLLGMHVPAPEVPADESNPKGFGESQWVVDFHDELLQQARVHGSDARPQGWFHTGELAMRERLRGRLSRWLEQQFEVADELVIKDPRLSWFMGLWRVAAMRCGATAGFVTMLRPPTEVILSKERYYGGRAANVGRTAAWINMMLHTERATRGTNRIFVRYDDLLTDWTSSIFRIGDAFDLKSVATADTHDIRRVHQFIDPSLYRMRLTWDDLEVPRQLREMADETWEQLNKLAAPGGESLVAPATFDALRHEYTELYAEAEAIAKSTITAVRATQTLRADRAIAEAEETRAKLEALETRQATVQASRTLADRVASRIPHGVRAAVPPNVRHGVRALLDRGRGGR